MAKDPQRILAQALEQAFAKKDHRGQARLPQLSRPLSIGGFTLPGGALVFFLPIYTGLYPPWALGHKPRRSPSKALIFLDSEGSCLTVSPNGQGGLSLKVSDHSRPLPASLKGQSPQLSA